MYPEVLSSVCDLDVKTHPIIQIEADVQYCGVVWTKSWVAKKKEKSKYFFAVCCQGFISTG